MQEKRKGMKMLRSPQVGAPSGVLMALGSVPQGFGWFGLGRWLRPL